MMVGTIEKIESARRYTRKEVASILNVSYASVGRMVRKGEFPEETHLRVKRILGRDLKRYLRDVRREAIENASFSGSEYEHLPMRRFQKEVVG